MLAILPKRPFLSKNCAKLLIYFDMCKKKNNFFYYQVPSDAACLVCKLTRHSPESTFALLCKPQTFRAKNTLVRAQTYFCA